MKTTKLILLLLAALTIQTTVYSQATLEWAARYIGANVYAMALDSMGNVIVSGHDGESPPGFVTVKFNSSGQFVWATRYSISGSLIPGPVAIAADSQGNIYVGAVYVDYIVIKYDSTGVQQWARRYRGGGGGSHDLYDLTLKDNYPSIVVTGRGFFSTGNYGCFTININSMTGDSIWARRYTPVYTSCRKIDDNDNININICGRYNIISPDYLTLSYSPDGNLRWTKTWNGPGNNIDVPYGVSSDNSGNVYVTGAGTMNAMNDQDISTIKYDSLGNEKWVRFFDGTGVYRYSYGEHIKIDPFGNVIVAGRDVQQNDYDFITLKYDPLGNLGWVKIYNGPANLEDFIKGLAVDKYGDVYITGSSCEVFTIWKFATIKYDKNGNQKWLKKYPEGDTISHPRAVIVDKNLNVYVGGTISAGAFGGMLVLKYSQPTVIKPVSSVTPRKFKLYQNYPNPFNPKSKIKMQIAKLGYVKLIVYDMLGREIAVLVNEELKPGTYEVEWDAGGRPSGIYFYRLECKEFSETKKMLIVK